MVSGGFLCDTSAIVSEGGPKKDDRDTVAADEPTAMWDSDALANAGIDPNAAGVTKNAGPATRREVGGDDQANVRVQPNAGAPASRPAPVAPAPGPASAGGMNWAITIGLAVGLAVGVYFLVRYLKG